MGSPLGSVLAGIFMVELERTIFPTLREHMSPWKRCVDDTIPYIKEESIEHVLSKLNGYHDNIEFTYEIENDGKIPFLDVQVIRKDYKFETTAYRKITNNNIYLHRQSFSPTTWKRGTLQTLVSRVFRVCSNDKHLENETKHLKKVFRDISGYPNWVIVQTIEKVKNQNEMTRSTQVTTKTEENEHLLMLPYKSKVGETTLKSLRNTLKSVIPVNNTCKIIYSGTKLASKFNIKDEISKNHKHDLIYKAQCSDLNCDETYIGEIGRRFAERILDHSGCDDKSHLYVHTEKTGPENVNIDHFEILSNGYKNNKFKRKFAEALHIKHERPTLNVQKHSVPLKLFN